MLFRWGLTNCFLLKALWYDWMAFPPQCNHQLLKSILRKSFCTIPPGLQRAIFQLQSHIYKTPYGKNTLSAKHMSKNLSLVGDQTRQKNEPLSPWGILKWITPSLHKWFKLKKWHKLKKTCGNISTSIFLGNKNRKALSDWWGCDCWVTRCVNTPKHWSGAKNRMHYSELML